MEPTAERPLRCQSIREGIVLPDPLHRYKWLHNKTPASTPIPLPIFSPPRPAVSTADRVLTMFTKAALCAVLYSLSASLLVASAPAEISVRPSRTVEPVVPVWPEYAFPGEHHSDELSVAASLAKKETNGDRMKRSVLDTPVM